MHRPSIHPNSPVLDLRTRMTDKTGKKKESKREIAHVLRSRSLSEPQERAHIERDRDADYRERQTATRNVLNDDRETVTLRI